MLPPPPTLPPHNQQTPSRQPHILSSPRLRRLPRLPASHAPIARLLQFMKAYWAGRKETQTYDWLAKGERLNVGGNAGVVGVFVYYAVLWSSVGGEDVIGDEAVDQPVQFWGHGWC